MDRNDMGPPSAGRVERGREVHDRGRSFTVERHRDDVEAVGGRVRFHLVEVQPRGADDLRLFAGCNRLERIAERFARA